mgnify:CR=1 FL=1
MFKIAITGPESTGKTTLSEKLAQHFNTDFVPEYSRTYLENFEGQYTEEDVAKIAELYPNLLTISPLSAFCSVFGVFQTGRLFLKAK